MRRIFVEGDGFFSWALPLYRAWGILVRVHLLFILIAVIRLISPIQPGAAGLAYEAFFIGSIFVFVLLHEYGHCFACRYVGGEADEILMWPLGGLAMCRTPHDWKKALITTVGGPAVNLVLALIFAGIMLALGAGLGVVIFNPFDRIAPIVREAWFNQDSAYWKFLLFFAYQANIYMFLFNVLMPMFPMDGGRIFQELLWARLGYRKSMQIAVNVGLVVAVAVGGYAVLSGSNSLLSIALFGGITCYMERRKLAMTQDEPWAESLRMTESEDARKYKMAAKQQERERQKQADVDRILAKIAASGMDSLSRSEKATLREATERKRAGA